MTVPSLRLNTGVEIPAIGFGTWHLADGGEVRSAVQSALEAGYRLIDTAKIYGNERGIGEAIKQSGVPREEIFVTTKLWNSDQGYEAALAAFDESLGQLGLEYVDLYLIHWPSGDARQDSWRALQAIHRQGRAKAIGVSNYMAGHLKEIIVSEHLPAVNQIEFHPFVYEDQKPVLEICEQHDIVVEAYSPLAQGRRMDNPTIIRIADSHQKTPAQVLLRWAIQHGAVPIPKSVTPERIKQNLEVFGFELSEDEMRSLDRLSSGDSALPSQS